MSDRDSSIDDLRPRLLRPLIQVGGFVRKEFADILRQPRLLVVLVAGPFVILMLFAAGYDQNSVRLRTIFVGPEGSIYETSVESYDDDLGRYVETVGFTSDVVSAEEELQSGDADLVVIFPSDPAETVLEGEQATITILHNKLDPIQQTAVEVSAQVAVQELNASVLEEVVSQAQEALTPVEQSVDEIEQLVDAVQLAAGAGDSDAVRLSTQDLRASLTSLQTVSALSNDVVTRLRGDADPEEQRRLDELNQTIDDLNTAADQIDAAASDEELRIASEQMAQLVDEVSPRSEALLNLDPRVATRPFSSDTENILRFSTRPNDFFAPSAISLILQHLAITFAALALVRDRAMGLFEIYRVGPVDAHHILSGKYLAYTVMSALVGAALVASVVLVLDVPLRGSVLWVSATLLLLVVASIGLGMVVSSLSRSDTQAVQYSMLLLLASLFFGGFFLSLDAFRYPIRLVSWVLPVTYSIRSLQSTMLRGESPATIDIISLAGLTLVYGAFAWFLLHRKLVAR